MTWLPFNILITAALPTPWLSVCPALKSLSPTDPIFAMQRWAYVVWLVIADAFQGRTVMLGEKREENGVKFFEVR